MTATQTTATLFFHRRRMASCMNVRLWTLDGFALLRALADVGKAGFFNVFHAQPSSFTRGSMKPYSRSTTRVQTISKPP